MRVFFYAKFKVHFQCNKLLFIYCKRKTILMINNDVLRRLRYIFELSDSNMMRLASSPETKVTRAEISTWLKKDDDPSQKACKDAQLAIFLNNFIDDKRGKQEGAQRAPEKSLTNNLIFMKLKIALNLRAEDVLEILALANFKLSKHELSAFFRKQGHKHYRECKDQILRNFLQGLQFKHRAADANKLKITDKKSDKKGKAKAASPTYQWKKIKPTST